jgi:hypothetical protein
MKLTIHTETNPDSGLPVWAWSFLNTSGGHVAGGYCATHAEAVSDALIWAKNHISADAGDSFKVAARSADVAAREPFVDWFDASTFADAVAAWKAQTEECGISADEIVLVSVARMDSQTYKQV